MKLAKTTSTPLADASNKRKRKSSSSSSKAIENGQPAPTKTSSSTSKRDVSNSPWEECFSMTKPKAHFCADCGSLLPLTSANEVKCKLCGFVVHADELDSQVIVTTSKPKSTVRQKPKKSAKSDRAIVISPPPHVASLLISC